MKRILYILLIVFFSMCKTPIVEFDNSENINLGPKEILLKDFKATETKYSVLIFTTGLEGEKLIVKNGNELIYNDSLRTNKIQPIAKLLRIKNTCNTKVDDLDAHISFEIKTSIMSKYKFVYVRKDYNRNRRYVITYSNRARGMF
jgi:hypothetical protein